MAYYLKRLWDYMWGSLYSQETLERDLKKALSSIEAINEDTDEDQSEDDIVLDYNSCIHCKGVVTTIATEYGLIDEKHYFKTNNVKCLGLKAGDRVSYVIFKVNGSETEFIRNIQRIEKDLWEQEDDVKQLRKVESKSGILERNLLAEVSSRNARQVTVKPQNITFNLDEVKSEFIPIVGDWIVMEAITEVDENVSDLTGDILNITRICPLRSKPVSGFIKSWSTQDQNGIIGNDIFFHKDVCEPGYMPCSGDKVVCEAIESSQGRCSWRAMTVSPLATHQLRQTKETAVTEVLAQLTTNKKGIEITDNLTFDSMQIYEKRSIQVIVTNTSNKSHQLIRYCFNSERSASQLTLLSHNFKNMQITILPNTSIKFEFGCEARFMGKTRELFVFHFRNFKIGRWFDINVQGRTTSTEIYTRKNYSNLARKMCDPRGTDVFRGIRLIKPPAFVPIKMGIYNIPNRLWEVVLGKNGINRSLLEITTCLEDIIPCLHYDLHFEIYNERFQALLYLEEIQMNVNIHAYDIERGHFIANGEYLMLEIPNLSERRPSLMIGDRIIVSEPWNTDVPKYEGYIHKIQSKHVFLKFCPAFHCGYSGQEYNIEFTFMRTSLRRCHQAIGLAIKHLGKDFLFPSSVTEKPPQVDFIDDGDILCQNTTKQPIQLHANSSADISERQITTKNTDEIPPKPYTKASNSDTTRINRKALSVQNLQVDNNTPEIKRNPNVKYRNNISKRQNSANAKLKKNFVWCNKDLNHQQKAAIKNVIKGVARPLPYIIFGPPGTGKTVTIVECVLQILRMIPGSRILIASPSNSSADLLAIRLLDCKILQPGDLVRLVAHRCIVEGTIPERLIPYCATGELAREGTRQPQEQFVEGVKLGCSTAVLGRHRITVATCVCLGQLYNMGFARGHFTHVLVDEAGQATEPEILIPLSLYDTQTGQVVLAGDPLQLGPVVMSSLAEHYGMEESLLVRLSRRFPYERDWQGFPESGGYDPRLITRLAINYRSVPEILKLPSTLFYDSELQPVISQTEGPEYELLMRLVDELPPRKTGGPPALVFHGVRGENFQHSDCPSWYNPHEATQVFFYINQFYNLGISAQDIGIITPYSKQVKEVRKLLIARDLDLPKICSVEEFQGQERNIIIMSTVRSVTSLIDTDVKHSIGFISSPRRLNVALTRAQALLIIIGNPHILAMDPYWRSVLVYCLSNDAYVGCDLPDQYMSTDNL